MKKNIWQKTSGENYVLNGKDFYISYNPDTAFAAAISPYGFLNDLGGLFDAPTSGAETALKDRKTGKFYILSGDFRKQYEKAFPSKKKCLEVYKKFKDEFRNEWSTDDL